MIHALDHDYEQISGRARVATIYDWQRRAWCDAVLIDIGRPDDVRAVDGEAAMQAEQMPTEGSQREAWLAEKRAERARCIAQLAAHIRQHGPVTKHEVGELLGLLNPGNWLQTNGRDAFALVGKLGRFSLYGLKEEAQP